MEKQVLSEFRFKEKDFNSPTLTLEFILQNGMNSVVAAELRKVR